MKKKVFTREEVINIIDDLLQRADLLMNCITIENYDCDAEELLEIAENSCEKVDS